MANVRDDSEPVDRHEEELLAIVQSSNDLAATANMNSARANKIAEAVSVKSSAKATNVAQGAKALALIGFLFSAVAVTITLLVIYL